MSSFYPYLIASLPTLLFAARPPFSYEEFLLKCKGFIPESDFQVLKNLNHHTLKTTTQPTIKRWLDFDTRLRNELVKVRAEHKKLEAAKYLRPDGDTDSSLYHIAVAAHRSLQPIEGERILDEARYRFLDEILFGHYFDLDFLIIYAYKLMILERWERINMADSERLLSEAIQ